MRNWTSVIGTGLTLYGPEVSGVPSEDAAWEYLDNQDGSFPDTGSSVIYGNKILFMGERDYLGCINADTGSLEWLVKQKTERPFFISTNGQHLIVDPCIIDANDGSLIINYSEVSGLHYEPSKKSRPTCNSHWAVMSWKEFDAKSGILVVDLLSMEVRRLQVEGCFPELVGESDDAIAVANGAVVRFNLEDGECIWQATISGIDPSQGAAVAVFENVTTVLVSCGWHVIDTKTGELLRAFRYGDVSDKLIGSSYSSARTDRHFYVYGRGEYPHLLGYDYLSDTLLFSKSIADLHRMCIAGDLLFIIRDLIDRKNYGESELVALDRFTGEQVWSAKKPLRAAYDVKACGNKIIFSSMSGILRCYQWTGKYTSPSRDRVGLRVVK